MILFVHVPRTSGKMIEEYIIPKKLRKIPKFHKQIKKLHSTQVKRSVDKFDIIEGAYPYGVHKYLEGDVFSYFTFLREPTKRFISAFNRDITFPNIVLPMWKESGKDLRKFLTRCIDEERNTNVFVKELSGLENPDDIVIDYRTHLYSWSKRTKVYTEAEMEEMLRVAKQNLVDNFDFVGLTGSKRSYRKLAKFYKWKQSALPKFNKSKPTKVGWGDAKCKKLLHRISKYDVKLFEFACEKCKEFM